MCRGLAVRQPKLKEGLENDVQGAGWAQCEVGAVRRSNLSLDDGCAGKRHFAATASRSACYRMNVLLQADHATRHVLHHEPTH